MQPLTGAANGASKYDALQVKVIKSLSHGLQVFSLLRLGLARAKSVSLTILDISPRVIEHIQRARETAAKNMGYVIQLPRDVAPPWPQDVVACDRVGTSVASIRSPEIFTGLETRAAPIILQRFDLGKLAPRERFDLIVAPRSSCITTPSNKAWASRTQRHAENGRSFADR